MLEPLNMEQANSNNYVTIERSTSEFTDVVGTCSRYSAKIEEIANGFPINCEYVL